MKKSLVLLMCCGVLGGSAAEFTPIDPLADSAIDEKKIPVVTGAEEFEVEEPAKLNDVTVNVADFGVSPDKSDNTAEFRAAVEAARKQKASRMVLPHGVYRFTSSDWLEFNGFSDFEFDGQGSTLIFSKPRDVQSCMFNIIGCRRVRFRNFRIDWDWERDLIASLVEVEKVDPERRWADFRFVDYRKFPQRDIRINLIDQVKADSTAGMGEGTFWLAPTGEKKWLGDNLLRVEAGSFNGGRMPEQLKPGQRFRMSHYYGTYTGVAMSGNVHLTLQDIDMYSCPGFAFHAYDGQHHWQMKNVNIVRKPGTFRPITVSADSVHITKAKGYFKMENCEMSFGNDDCFNVNDQSRTGIRRGEKTLHVVHRSGGFFVGDEIEFRNADYSPAGVTSRLVAERPVKTPEGEVWEMEFADPLPGKAGGRLILFNREQGSKNIILRDCYFHDNRAHGMRLQANDITVENCRFVNNAMGIAITTGYTLNSWCEGYGASNILLRNNIFSGVNQSNYHAAEKSPMVYIGVFLKNDPSPERTSYPIISRILFEGNRFVNSPGVISYISSGRDIVFRNNTVVNDRPSLSGVAERGGVAADWCGNLFLVGNRWMKSEFMPPPQFLSGGAGVRNVYFRGNQLCK